MSASQEIIARFQILLHGLQSFKSPKNAQFKVKQAMLDNHGHKKPKPITTNNVITNGQVPALPLTF